MLHPKGTSNASQRGATSAWRTHYAKKHTLISCLEFLQCGLIVDECNHYLSVRRHIRLFDEDEITILDSLLIHGVTIGTEEKILLAFRDNLGGYWDLGFDIFLCEYRHPTCDGTDEGDIAYSYTICLEWWRYLYLVAWVSIDPSLRHELFEHDRYGARGSVPECTLECSYGELLTLSDELSDLLEDDLFLGGELFHNSSGVKR